MRRAAASAVSFMGIQKAHNTRSGNRQSEAKGHPIVHCPAGELVHEFAEEYLIKTPYHAKRVFLILVGRVQAPVWDLGAKHLTVNLFQKS
jgi:hypothetical protein